MFVERYVASLNSSDLRDDDMHHATEPLHASASADLGAGAVLGSLLVRAKFAGCARKTFESGIGDIAQLLAVWNAEVAKRGRERQWVKIASERDIQTAHILFKRVAEKSLAHWLDPNCGVCNGTKLVAYRKCPCCGGTGLAEIECSGQYELGKIKDAVSELEGICQAHSARAGRKLRRVA